MKFKFLFSSIHALILYENPVLQQTSAFLLETTCEGERRCASSSFCSSRGRCLVYFPPPPISFFEPPPCSPVLLCVCVGGRGRGGLLMRLCCCLLSCTLSLVQHSLQTDRRRCSHASPPLGHRKHHRRHHQTCPTNKSLWRINSTRSTSP